MKCLPLLAGQEGEGGEAVLCLGACEILISLRAHLASPSPPALWPGNFPHFYSHATAPLYPSQLLPRRTKKFSQDSLGKMPTPGIEFILQPLVADGFSVCWDPKPCGDGLCPSVDMERVCRNACSCLGWESIASL